MSLDSRLERLETSRPPDRVTCRTCGVSARSGGVLVVPVERLRENPRCPSCGEPPLISMPDNGRGDRR